MKLVITGDTHYGFSDQTHDILDAFWERVKAEKPAIVLHAGDWGTSNPKEVELAVLQVVNVFQRGPRWPLNFVSVMGNHDYWNDERTTEDVLRVQERFSHMVQRVALASGNGNISTAHLTGTRASVELRKGLPKMLRIYGQSGWYSHPNPPTKDVMYMNPWVVSPGLAMSAFEFLKGQAENRMRLILNQVDLKDCNIYLTHLPGGEPFGSDPHMMELMAKRFDVIVRGHSHKAEDFVWHKARVLNAGSDYDDPQYLVLNLTHGGHVQKVRFNDGRKP